VVTINTPAKIVEPVQFFISTLRNSVGQHYYYHIIYAYSTNNTIQLLSGYCWTTAIGYKPSFIAEEINSFIRINHITNYTVIYDSSIGLSIAFLRS